MGKQLELAKVEAASDLGKLKLLMVAGGSGKSDREIGAPQKTSCLLPLSMFSEPSLGETGLVREGVFRRAGHLKAVAPSLQGTYRWWCMPCSPAPGPGQLCTWI